MFDESSRYFKAPTDIVKNAQGKEVRIVKLRRLPKIETEVETVCGNERLDVMAHRLSGDGTEFWRIGDANSELESNRLLDQPGRQIKVPKI